MRMIYASNNLFVIGSSHLSKTSPKIIKSIISRKDIDLVMIELDRDRLYSILKKKEDNFISFFRKNFRNLGFVTTLFLLILRSLQKGLGKRLGIIPGRDMITAYKVAKKLHKKYFLIDQPLIITASKLSKVLGFRGIFLLLFGTIFSRKGSNMDIKSFFYDPLEEEVEHAKKLFKETSPALFRVLVEERNRYMAKNALQIIRAEEEKLGRPVGVVIVTGAMHAREIFNLLTRSYRGTLQKTKK